MNETNISCGLLSDMYDYLIYVSRLVELDAHSSIFSYIGL
jgi:hypothetical protein